jgi:prepilin-type processing-associated H-X9-DG protein
MKLFRFLLIPVLLVTAIYSSASAQSTNTVLNHIMEKTAKIYNAFPIEKVYLHFDKPYYAVGDTIWFKAYLTVDNHVPSTLSKIIYVDILGPRDSLIQSAMLQVKNGEAWSDFELPQTSYKKGNYRIVAYTNWMNNFDPAYFFNKNITIGDAINNDLSTQINLKSSVVNKQTKVTAGIYYKDNKGEPLAGKKVSWSIQKDDEPVGKGKGETDKDGFIAINYINLKNTSLDSAKLVTTIENSQHKQLPSIFPLKSIAGPNDIQFFPEGGSLVVGLPSKVAFKAINPSGLGVDVKGTVVDNDNKVVTEFTSAHLGMGSFMLTPEDNKTYKANIAYADGSVASIDLPKIQTGDINLSVDNSNDDVLNVRLQTDAPFLKEYTGKTFFIIAKSLGVICFAAQTQLQNLVYNASIPKTKFPSGIVQITLFTADGEAISERIAFIQHNDQLKLGLSTALPVYTTRQKVKLNVSAKADNNPVAGNFSVSVVDVNKVPFDENSESTILTSLLLTSDIKGYIEKPNYYFNHPDAKTAADLDLLMQTQGYRRYSYDGIMNDKYPAITILPEQGINISGTLRSSTGIPKFNGNVKLSIRDNNFFQNATTDADGHFKFANLVFLDSAKVNITARNNDRGSDLVLSLDGEPAQRIGQNYDKPNDILNIDSALSPYLKNSKVKFNTLHVLKEVVIHDKIATPVVSHKDYGSLSGLSSEPDHLISGKLFHDCPNVLECLKSLVPGAVFENDKFYVQRDYAQGKRVPMQIFVKGMPVESSYLTTLTADNMESVEIFLKDDLGLINSTYQSNGAIVVNLKKAPVGTKVSLSQLNDLLPKKYEVDFMPKGYAAIKSFYMPRYSGPRESQTTLPDTRSTIYWNPNVTTDATGTASVDFFNADGKGTYRATIEGIDKDGHIGRQVYNYTVK